MHWIPPSPRALRADISAPISHLFSPAACALHREGEFQDVGAKAFSRTGVLDGAPLARNPAPVGGMGCGVRGVGREGHEVIVSWHLDRTVCATSPLQQSISSQLITAFLTLDGADTLHGYPCAFFPPRMSHLLKTRKVMAILPPTSPCSSCASLAARRCSNA